MMNNLFKFCFILSTIFAWVFALPHTIYAGGPTMQVLPIAVALPQNSTTTLSVTANSAGNEIFGADSILTYNPNAIEIVSVIKGNTFTDFSFSNNPNSGKLEIHGYFASLRDLRTVNGTIAIITVKAKKNTGTASINFICNNSPNSSQMLDSKGHNILPCTETNQSIITMTGANTSAPSSTIIPNSPPNCATISLVPSSGYAPLTITATCVASDGENDITSAEFDFGDGNKKVIEKNIGQNGSMSTSYTYTKAGFFTVLCRVKDNNQAYSAIIDQCKTTVDIKTKMTTSSPKTVATSTPLVLEKFATPTTIETITSVSATPTRTIQEAQNKSPFMFQLGKFVAITVVGIMIAFIIRGFMTR